MTRAETATAVAVAELVAGEIEHDAPVEVVGRVLPSRLVDGAASVILVAEHEPAYAWVRVRGRWDAHDEVLRADSIEELRSPLHPPIPESHAESRAVVDPQRVERIVERAKAVALIRRRLEAEGYVEVATPVVQSAAEMGFINQACTEPIHGRRFYLRTDPEEYLKRYLTAGLEAVYEVSTNVRADAIDLLRLNEFASVEYYKRLLGFPAALELGDRLVREVIRALGGDEVVWGGAALDLRRPFAQRTYREAILEATGIDIDPPELASAAALGAAVRDAGLGLEIEGPPATWRRNWLEELADRYVLPALREPTWLTYFPAELALNALIDPEDPKRSLLGELYVPGGLELARTYECLTEPTELRERYLERLQHRRDGGLPDVPVNEGLMQSAEIGMPPLGGGAIGIDRIAMIGWGDEEIGRGLLFAREPLLPSAEALDAR
jgi:lysyl-tRNA synthetase, class II